MTENVPMTRARRTGWMLWLAATLLWMAALVAERLVYSGPISCELAEGGSVFGEPGWSWLPLGHTCTWRNVGGAETVVDQPSMMTLVPPVILLLWGFSLVAGRFGGPRGRDRNSGE